MVICLLIVGYTSLPTCCFEVFTLMNVHNLSVITSYELSFWDLAGEGLWWVTERELDRGNKSEINNRPHWNG